MNVMKNIIQKHMQEHQQVLDSLGGLESSIEKVAMIMVACLKNGGTIFWCGNGGSSSDSQHLAAEFIGRYDRDRRPLRSLSLTADSSVITCISNDYGFEMIFSRQIEGLGKPGDIIVAITTSGQSKNIYNALLKANELKIKTIGFLGRGGGRARTLCDEHITVNSNNTARIQEMHILIGHILCDAVENGLNLQ